jgi:dimethylargininase
MMRAVQGPQLLVRRPSPRLEAGELTHLARSPVDAELALEQWRAYVDVFRRTGWTVTEVAPLDAHPDGVFVEDTVVVFEDLAVLTTPGAASRVGEVASTRRALEGSLPLEACRLPGSSRLGTWRAVTS